MELPLQPCDLLCDLRPNPMGLSAPRPRLAWALAGGGQGAVSTAWQVQVGTAPGAADLWDSGRVPGEAQTDIRYAGVLPGSRQRCHWRVRVWDREGRPGPWSDPAWFETAFQEPGEFPGAWIGLANPRPDERRILAEAGWIRLPVDRAAGHGRWSCRIDLAPGFRRARLHILMDGAAQPWACPTQGFVAVNGSILEASLLWPRRTPLVLDLDACLVPGANHLAVRHPVHPNGAFIALVEWQDADGTRRTVATGREAWHGSVLADDAAPSAWTSPTVNGAPGISVGPFGAGPWPADDRRNRLDRVIPALEVRHRFAVAAAPVRARLAWTAAGAGEVRVNGQPAGDGMLAPGWTDYRVRMPYAWLDVTPLIRAGENEIRATVGDGWWCSHLAGPFDSDFYGHAKGLKLALFLDFADGSAQVIASDPATWEAGTGPIRAADLLDGQVIDATRTIVWRAAEPVPAPRGVLMVRTDPPVRPLQVRPVAALTQPCPGTVLADFGQNLVGHVRLALRAPRGTRLTVRHAEVLDLHGRAWTGNLRNALAIDEFICSGGDDVFAPTLTFHGFRYVEISGLPTTLAPEALAAVVVGSDTPERGAFACGLPLLNRLQANIRWGQRGNFLSIPTDCPQRDERLGWTADTQVFAATAQFNADCAAFYRKYVDDLLDGQFANGAFPDYAPTEGGSYPGRFGWADAGIVMPWTLWRTTGDTAVIDRAWDGMARYLAQRDRTAVADLNADWSYGDWVSPSPQTPNAVLNPIFHAWMHALMAAMAEASGRAEEAAHHRLRHRAIADAWARVNLAVDGTIHTSDTQAAYACAIEAGVIPAALLPASGRRLIAAVERAGDHLATGFLGTAHLLPALSRIGRSDVAWRILRQETYPGWLYTVRCGATTMWERWDSYHPDTGPANVGNMNSYNHYAFGAVGAWMYAHIGGIAQAPGDAGFRHLHIRPVPDGDCTHGSAEHRCVRGVIRCAWQVADGRITLDVGLPPNTTAEVELPCSGTVRCPAGVEVLERRPDLVRFRISAGDWTFAAPYGLAVAAAAPGAA